MLFFISSVLMYDIGYFSSNVGILLNNDRPKPRAWESIVTPMDSNIVGNISKEENNLFFVSRGSIAGLIKIFIHLRAESDVVVIYLSENRLLDSVVINKWSPRITITVFS